MKNEKKNKKAVPILYFTYDILKKFIINAIELVHDTTVSGRQQLIYIILKLSLTSQNSYMSLLLLLW